VNNQVDGVRRSCRGQAGVGKEAPFNFSHVNLFMLNAALPCVDAMNLQRTLSTQLIDQKAGAGAFIRPNFKYSLGLDLRYELLPDRPHIPKSVIGEFEIGGHVGSFHFLRYPGLPNRELIRSAGMCQTGYEARFKPLKYRTR
jgi:hypothetical protein